jgi:hypothetical protein
MSKLSQSVGLGSEVVIGEQTWNLVPLNVFDVIRLERELERRKSPGPGRSALEFVDVRDEECVSLITWLMLRKADPDLTQAERDDCLYKMTLREARDLQVSQNVTWQLVRESGLFNMDDSGEAAPKKSPTKSASPKASSEP